MASCWALPVFTSPVIYPFRLRCACFSTYGWGIATLTPQLTATSGSHDVIDGRSLGAPGPGRAAVPSRSVYRTLQRLFATRHQKKPVRLSAAPLGRRDDSDEEEGFLRGDPLTKSAGAWHGRMSSGVRYVSGPDSSGITGMVQFYRFVL